MLGAPTRGGRSRLVSSAGGPDPPKVSTTSSAGGPDPLQAVMRWREGVGANGYFSREIAKQFSYGEELEEGRKQGTVSKHFN